MKTFIIILAIVFTLFFGWLYLMINWLVKDEERKNELLKPYLEFNKELAKKYKSNFKTK